MLLVFIATVMHKLHLLRLHALDKIANRPAQVTTVPLLVKKIVEKAVDHGLKASGVRGNQIRGVESFAPVVKDCRSLYDAPVTTARPWKARVGVNIHDSRVMQTFIVLLSEEWT
jgi:hypothetical protein